MLLSSGVLNAGPGYSTKAFGSANACQGANSNNIKIILTLLVPTYEYAAAAAEDILSNARHRIGTKSFGAQYLSNLKLTNFFS